MRISNPRSVTSASPAPFWMKPPYVMMSSCVVMLIFDGEAPGSVAVVISADRNVKYETVVKAMDVLQRAGVQRVGLSVKQGTP